MEVIRICSDWMCGNIPKHTHTLTQNLILEYENTHKPFCLILGWCYLKMLGNPKSQMKTPVPFPFM